MKIPKRLPAIAAALAFCLAALGLLAAQRQIPLAVFALIPLAAAIGILRRRVWSAYGFALVQAGQLAVAPLLLSRTGNVSRLAFAFTILFSSIFAIVFLLAGRALAQSGAPKGWAAPWIAIAALTSIPFFFLQAFVIPSGAMEDTLLIGDHVLVRVFPAVKVSEGDILVFRYPLDPRQTYVKRVIGLPGDHIRISGSTVYRNGKALLEPYVTHKFPSSESSTANFPPDPGSHSAPELPSLRAMLNEDVSDGQLVVPPNRYFVLGDNRDNSFDSRYWGFIRPSDIIGKTILIYDSEEPATGSGKGNGFHPNRIRWNRIFRVP